MVLNDTVRAHRDRGGTPTAGFDATTPLRVGGEIGKHIGAGGRTNLEVETGRKVIHRGTGGPYENHFRRPVWVRAE